MRPCTHAQTKSLNPYSRPQHVCAAQKRSRCQIGTLHNTCRNLNGSIRAQLKLVIWSGDIQNTQLGKCFARLGLCGSVATASGDSLCGNGPQNLKTRCPSFSDRSTFSKNSTISDSKSWRGLPYAPVGAVLVCVALFTSLSPRRGPPNSAMGLNEVSGQGPKALPPGGLIGWTEGLGSSRNSVWRLKQAH
jgi:hypothetical protein